MHLNKICVFCGSKMGNASIYEETARSLGGFLAENHIDLIYGSGGTGLMKAVAEECKEKGGHVIGMTTQYLFDLERPDLMEGLIDDIKVYPRMFARKVAMTKESDAFVVLPGGLGTMDELFELMVLKQLNLLDKPTIILNTNYFFDGFKALIHQFVRDGFLGDAHVDKVTFVDNVEDVLPEIRKQIG